MLQDEIIQTLFSLRDEAYGEFQGKLIPNVDKSRIIGVRLPALRAYAKEIAKRADKDEFFSALPHYYYDENQLHACAISLEKDFDRAVAAVEAFLPTVDNWAVCDSLSPAAFKKNKEKLLPYLDKWLGSGEVYTVRFAVKMLMALYLDQDFDPRYPALVAAICSEEYYVNMMRAWYFATALAKQYEAALPYLTENRLDVWTHNKTIQKAVESYRVSAERKQLLKTLRRRAGEANA